MARNKVHKQRFNSKHATANKAKGKAVGEGRRQGAKSRHVSRDKDQQRQSAIARRERKRLEALAKKRLSGMLPRVIGVVPANESGNTEQVVRGFCDALHEQVEEIDTPFTVSSKETKGSFTFVCEKNGDDQDCIDVVKVSDVVVLVLDASQAVQEAISTVQKEFAAAAQDDEDGDAQTMATTWFSDVGLCITDYTRDLVAAINAQGSPNIVVILQNLHTFSEKQQQKVLRVHQRYFMSVLHADATKVVRAAGAEDYSTVLRHMQMCKLRVLPWREQHPYFVIEHTAYDATTREMTVGGVIRGQPLAATQLLHLTNFGTFQIKSIAVDNEEDDDATAGRRVVDAAAPEERESLEQLRANATLAEDGLPTESDVRFHEGGYGDDEEGHAARAKSGTKHKVRVPAGVSEYQAAWYDTEENVVSDDGGDDGEGEDRAGVAAEEHAAGARNTVRMDATRADSEQEADEDALAAMEAMSHRTTRTEIDFLKAEDVVRLERMTDEERAAELQRLKEMSEEEAWNPDVVDTPVNIPARQRFAKYRGLKSFRTGKWDVTENLPTQYAYIYKLQGYARIRQHALARCAEGAAAVGTFVYVTLLDVPAEVAARQEGGVRIASGQLEHEQKWSVLHFQVQRASEWDEPVKSKTPMLAHIGFRKFYVAPLFSDVCAGDRTKFARVFHEHDKFRLASFFGPISFTPCPILLYQVPSLEEQAEGNPLRLFSFGAALPPNPDFLILKRAVLTGRVAVVQKKQIVVKYMFFNEDDVKWFQPVDLYTRLGRRGKIVRSVGTHGLFKAVLNDQVMQHDVVCMDLYKRVFPKWTTVPYVSAHAADEADGDESVDSEAGDEES